MFFALVTISFLSAVSSAGGLEVSFGKSENRKGPHLMTALLLSRGKMSFSQSCQSVLIKE